MSRDVQHAARGVSAEYLSGERGEPERHDAGSVVEECLAARQLQLAKSAASSTSADFRDRFVLSSLQFGSHHLELAEDPGFN